MGDYRINEYGELEEVTNKQDFYDPVSDTGRSDNNLLSTNFRNWFDSVTTQIQHHYERMSNRFYWESALYSLSVIVIFSLFMTNIILHTMQKIDLALLFILLIAEGYSIHYFSNLSVHLEAFCFVSVLIGFTRFPNAYLIHLVLCFALALMIFCLFLFPSLQGLYSTFRSEEFHRYSPVFFVSIAWRAVLWSILLFITGALFVIFPILSS